VFQDFLDSETCNSIAKSVRVNPIIDSDGVLQSTVRHHSEAEDFIFEKFKPVIPEIEKHFTNFKYKGTEHLVFQQFPVTNGNQAEPPHCENAVFKRKRWIKTKDRDLTGILWLKDYKESPPFDVHTEVLGGKLEFPVYNFGFQAQKGTLVLYPASERFISLTSPILVGELQCVRFHIAAEGIWIYDPLLYPGDFRTWFSSIV
jgi:hypothetical protein